MGGAFSLGGISHSRSQSQMHYSFTHGWHITLCNMSIRFQRQLGTLTFNSLIALWHTINFTTFFSTTFLDACILSSRLRAEARTHSPIRYSEYHYIATMTHTLDIRELSHNTSVRSILTAFLCEHPSSMLYAVSTSALFSECSMPNNDLTLYVYSHPIPP